MQVLNAEDSRLKVEVSQGQNTGFQMKTHPNIDKALYSSQSVLGLKDPQRPFPAGSPLGILKWRMQVICLFLKVLLRFAWCLYKDLVTSRLTVIGHPQVADSEFYLFRALLDVACPLSEKSGVMSDSHVVILVIRNIDCPAARAC